MSVSGRYELHCVAGMRGTPSYDDIDEAIVNLDAHYDLYDTQTREYVPITCMEEVDAAAKRLAAKQSAS